MGYKESVILEVDAYEADFIGEGTITLSASLEGQGETPPLTLIGTGTITSSVVLEGQGNTPSLSELGIGYKESPILSVGEYVEPDTNEGLGEIEFEADLFGLGERPETVDKKGTGTISAYVSLQGIGPVDYVISNEISIFVPVVASQGTIETTVSLEGLGELPTFDNPNIGTGTNEFGVLLIGITEGQTYEVSNEISIFVPEATGFGNISADIDLLGLGWLVRTFEAQGTIQTSVQMSGVGFASERTLSNILEVTTLENEYEIQGIINTFLSLEGQGFRPIPPITVGTGTIEASVSLPAFGTSPEFEFGEGRGTIEAEITLEGEGYSEIPEDTKGIGTITLSVSMPAQGSTPSVTVPNAGIGTIGIGSVEAEKVFYVKRNGVFVPVYGITKF